MVTHMHQYICIAQVIRYQSRSQVYMYIIYDFIKSDSIFSEPRYGEYTSANRQKFIVTTSIDVLPSKNQVLCEYCIYTYIYIVSNLKHF